MSLSLELSREMKLPRSLVFSGIRDGLFFNETGVINSSFKLDFRVGGRYSFEWISGGFCSGEFLEIVENERVVFSWVSEGCAHPPGQKTLVTITLKDSPHGTSFQLKHEGFATEASRDDHRRGWTGCADDFASSLSSRLKAQDYDWSKFDIYLRFDVSPERLFQAWATSGGMESFFIEKAVFKTADGRMRAKEESVQSGDRYDWRWIHGPSSYGRFLEVRKNEKVSFSFGDNDVDVTFEPGSGFTWLHLRQCRIKETSADQVVSHLNCHGGWVYFLTILKGVLEKGVDIRDHNPESAGSLAVWFQP